MPLTVSHTAAVLPLLRSRRLILSALVIGAMIPDLPYFAPFLNVSRPLSHSVPGLFLFCAPWGIAAYVVWRTLLREPLVRHGPAAVRRRLRPASTPTRKTLWRHGLAVAVSVLLGALTHIAWDGITHEHAAVQIAALQGPAFDLFGWRPRIYNVLKHGSTLLGGAALLTFAAVWYWRTPPQDDSAPRQPAMQALFWAMLFFLPATAALIAAYSAGSWPVGIYVVRDMLREAAVAGLTAVLWSTLAFGLIATVAEKWRQRRRARADAPPSGRLSWTRR
jgi:hypothetical protein